MPRHLAFFTPGQKQDTGFSINQNQIILPQRNMDFAQKARGVLNWGSWVLFPEVGTCSQAWEVRKPGVSSGAVPLWWALFLPPPTAPSGPVLISSLAQATDAKRCACEWICAEAEAATLAWHGVASPPGDPPQAPLWWSCVSGLERALFTLLNLFWASYLFFPSTLYYPGHASSLECFCCHFSAFCSWQLYSESKESCNPKQAGWERD